jgi:hypothetical protein
VTQVAWEHVGWGPRGFGGELLDLGATRARGVILWMDERSGSYRLEYAIDWEPGWVFRRITIDLTGRSAAGLELTRAADGRWAKNGIDAPELRACTEVDLWPTPFTNSLPIHRLRLEPGAAMRITVAHVVAPELTVTPRPQRYTNLGDGVYRFESLDDGFTADLTLDRSGLVVDYPGLFRRQEHQDRGTARATRDR